MNIADREDRDSSTEGSRAAILDWLIDTERRHGPCAWP